MINGRVKFIDSKSSSVLGSQLLLNQNGIDDVGFVVKWLFLRIAVTLAGVPAGVLGAVDMGTGVLSSVWRRTNEPWHNSLSFRALDLGSKRSRKQSSHDYDVLTDQTAAARTHFFDFILPIRQQNGTSPRDYCVPLSEIGQFTVQLPATLAPVTAGMILSDISCSLYAVGYDAAPGEYVAGVLTRIDELTAETGLQVEINAQSRRVRDLFGYSADTATSPIGGNTSMRVEIDGREVVNARGLTGAEMPYLLAGKGDSDDYVDFALNGSYDNVLLEDILPMPSDARIAEMPTARIVRVSYSARMVAPAEQRYVLTTLYPSSALGYMSSRIPGASGADAQQLSTLLTTQGADGKATAPNPFLPVTLRA